MSDSTPQDQILAIGRDDELLDALGRGELVEDHGDIAELLAAWRADLADEPPRPATVRLAYPAVDIDTGATAAPGRRRPTRRFAPASRRTRLAVAAAVAAAVIGGLALASANATPGSPLWPISKVMNPQRADRLDAENALTQARRAIDERHLAQARTALDQAAELISRVRDPRQAAQLRTELDQLRQLLAAATAGLPLPTPGASGVPAPSSAPGHAGQPTGGGGGTGGTGTLLPPLLPPPGTNSSGSGGGLLPTTLPPLPSLLPSLLPTLPLPNIGG